MPVGYLTLVAGRIIAYMGVCLVQCALIGCIGKWILPLWGTPPLTMGGDPTALGAMVISAIFAATGYGILLGTIVNSFEQAAMFGPISIVIAAALGGVMVRGICHARLHADHQRHLSAGLGAERNPGCVCARGRLCRCTARSRFAHCVFYGLRTSRLGVAAPAPVGNDSGVTCFGGARLKTACKGGTAITGCSTLLFPIRQQFSPLRQRQREADKPRMGPVFTPMPIAIPIRDHQGMA